MWCDWLFVYAWNASFSLPHACGFLHIHFPYLASEKLDTYKMCARTCRARLGAELTNPNQHSMGRTGQINKLTILPFKGERRKKNRESIASPVVQMASPSLCACTWDSVFYDVIPSVPPLKKSPLHH